jgi:putative DNA methylase
MPLVRSFDLSKKKGKVAWVEPQVDAQTRRISFTVKQATKGSGPEGTVNRLGATCIACGTPAPFPHVRDEGKAGRMSAQLMAIVTEGQNGRNYHAPDSYHVQIAAQAQPAWKPDHPLPHNPRDFKTPNYGMTTFADLFTPRQLVALTTFSDLVAEARQQILNDALAAGLPDDDIPLRDGGTGGRAYAEAVSVYLSMTIGRQANRLSSICFWDTSGEKVQQVFARQAIPMNWDYTEANPFSSSSGNFIGQLTYLAKVIEFVPANVSGYAWQHDATEPFRVPGTKHHIFATDPPYYDNIGYADLSDFFYVWLRPSIKGVFPTTFGTMLSPKEPELIASPYRHEGDSSKAVRHFENGFVKAFASFRQTTDINYPLTLFYAFKQSEANVLYGKVDQGVSSTGWETMLEGMMQAGFEITGTWPIRTEFTQGLKLTVNALASSIVLVCRPRPENAPVTARRDFVNALRQELPAALREMQSGNIAPVDLAQASIGPGMAVYSRYSKVLEPNGDRLTVRAALQLINQVLDEFLAETEGDLDADSRFAVTWFEQYGYKKGDFGVADVLARAKNSSVEGLRNSGLVTSGAGEVQLRHWQELDPGWDAAGIRPSVWQATHQLIERLHSHGEEGAATLLAQMPPDPAAAARQLAYRLYSICERKGWAEHGRDYNALVLSWSSSQERAVELKTQYQQQRLFE